MEPEEITPAQHRKKYWEPCCCWAIRSFMAWKGLTLERPERESFAFEKIIVEWWGFND